MKQVLLRYIIGIVVMYLAISKLISIDYFEIDIYKIGLFNLNTSFIVSRLIVSVGIVVAVLLPLYFKIKNVLITIFIIVVGVLIPMIISPPDSFYIEKFSEKVSYNKQELNVFLDAHPKYKTGKYVLNFFGTGCKFCKLASNKISVISNKSNNSEKINTIFWGSEKTISNFYKNTNSAKFEEIILEGNVFLKITDGSMPIIFLINDGVVEERFGYRSIDEYKIINFLK